ncbi:MAG: dienelactone hydrolase family protein [Gammaproteobacteria bacterium]
MDQQWVNVAIGDKSMRAAVTMPPSGSGPGLVLLPEIFGMTDFVRQTAERLAEEGYVCLVPDVFWRQQAGTALAYSEMAQALALRAAFDMRQGVDDLEIIIQALRDHPAQHGGVAAVGFCMGGTLACLSAARGLVDCAVAYYPTSLENFADLLSEVSCPLVIHLGDDDDKISDEARATIHQATGSQGWIKSYVYPGCGHAFANRDRPAFNKPAAMMAYSSTIATLRQNLGPIYDLSAIWEQHTAFEFGDRDVDATMGTMVDQPYVNHIPTMTGGVGHDHLKRFYKYHFVNSNPPDTRLVPVSRTVGADRLVDEMVFCFTHTCEIPWMLPGIEPTGKYVEVPLVAIVNFRGDKLYHEHIYWDQASVLHQIGKLDAAGLPVAGIETAKKLVDETLPSNELMGQLWHSSEGQPL